MCDSLPDKIKRIDVIRVERGAKKMCRCKAPHYQIDAENHLVYCVDCDAIVDPFEALLGIVRHYDRLSDQVNEILEQRRKIINYKPRLMTIKNLEQHYMKSFVPRCPHCREAFDFTDITEWMSAIFLNHEEAKKDV